MNGDAFLQNWALWLAILPAVLVLMSVAADAWRRTARGQLAKRRGDYRRAARLAADARKNHDRACRRVERLERQASRTRPSVLEEARAVCSDSKTLAGIADDRVQVAANQLRKVICEEFPPDRQESLRNKFLPGEGVDRRPFSF